MRVWRRGPVRVGTAQVCLRAPLHLRESQLALLSEVIDFAHGYALDKISSIFP